MSLLVSCNDNSSSLDCITSEDLTERWFEIASPTISFDHCYLLTKDGIVLEKTKDTFWKEGEWYIIDHCDDCLFEIGAGDKTIELLSKEDECITVKYSGIETQICDCVY